MDGTRELWQLGACEVVELLKAGAVTPLELIDVAVARLAVVEPAVNAVPLLCVERARADARALRSRGHPACPPDGYLYGLPIVVKDLSAVAGVRSRCDFWRPVPASPCPPMER